jgi:hypothetical protein
VNGARSVREFAELDIRRPARSIQLIIPVRANAPGSTPPTDTLFVKLGHGEGRPPAL